MYNPYNPRRAGANCETSENPDRYAYTRSLISYSCLSLGILNNMNLKICTFIHWHLRQTKIQLSLSAWALRKHAYSNLPKKGKISEKNADIFYFSAQNIHCGHSLEPPRRGGSNEYPQSMFLAK